MDKSELTLIDAPEAMFDMWAAIPKEARPYCFHADIHSPSFVLVPSGFTFFSFSGIVFHNKPVGREQQRGEVGYLFQYPCLEEWLWEWNPEFKEKIDKETR